MASFDDVARVAAGLPEVREGARFGNRTWFVRDKAFAWERPFSQADLRRFGEQSPPAGPIAAVSVLDLGEKEAVLASQAEGIFTIEHFSGFPAVLLQLAVLDSATVEELVVDGWLARAPRRLAEDYLRS